MTIPPRGKGVKDAHPFIRPWEKPRDPAMPPDGSNGPLPDLRAIAREAAKGADEVRPLALRASGA